MTEERKEETQPIPGTDTQRQPNEKPEKQYAQKEGRRFEQYQKEQRDHGTDNIDPGHPYEHRGDRISDKSSHR